MKTRKFVRIGLSLLVFCLLGIHCADPNLPTINVVSPLENTFAPESLPTSVEVAFRVPVPGCGAATFPVDPDSFTATLTRRLDGRALEETDITAAFSRAQDPGTGAYTYTAVLEFADYGDYEVYVTIQNGRGMGLQSLLLRVEQKVASFQGGDFAMRVSSLKQQPPNCLFPDVVLNVIMDIIRNTVFRLVLPSGADILQSGSYPLTIALPLPLGLIDVLLSADQGENEILIDGPDSYTIDLTGLAPLPGFDCVITASADGVFDDLDPYDPDGSLTIGILEVEPSPQGQGCTLHTPVGACSLVVGMDANPVLGQ